MKTEETKIKKPKKVSIRTRKRIARIAEQVQSDKLVGFTTIPHNADKTSRKYKKFDPDAKDNLLKHSFGVAVDGDMREWINEECKKRSLRTGYKVSPADIVRSLIEQEMKDEEVVKYVSPFGNEPTEDFSKNN